MLLLTSWGKMATYCFADTAVIIPRCVLRMCIFTGWRNCPFKSVTWPQKVDISHWRALMRNGFYIPLRKQKCVCMFDLCYGHGQHFPLIPHAMSSSSPRANEEATLSHSTCTIAYGAVRETNGRIAWIVCITVTEDVTFGEDLWNNEHFVPGAHPPLDKEESATNTTSPQWTLTCHIKPQLCQACHNHTWPKLKITLRVFPRGILLTAIS